MQVDVRWHWIMLRNLIEMLPKILVLSKIWHYCTKIFREDCGVKHGSKGFTIAELLIVVAIIAVLSAIAVPVFGSQLEKSREATDLANVRIAYGEVIAAALTEDTSSPLYNGGIYIASVKLSQAADGWTTRTDGLAVGGVAFSDDEHWLMAPKAKGTCQVYFDKGQVFINWNSGQAIPADLTESNSGSWGFLDKVTLDHALGSSYKYSVVNSNEPFRDGGTDKFLSTVNGFDAASYGAAVWQIYVKEPSGGASAAMLNSPAMYWSTVEASAMTEGTYIPVIGYRDGAYDVYMAKVVQYNKNTPNAYYSLSNNFANITNAGGSASFQFSSYEEAMAKYNEALSRYKKNGDLTKQDMQALGL